MAKLEDGFQTTITFATATTTKLYHVSITPPGLSGEGSIDTTTMSNTTYRTFAPKSLKTSTEASGTSAYDTESYDDLLAMIGTNQLITITFPDTSTYAFYGFLNEFTPGELTEGEMPTGDFTIIPTNVHSSTGAETAPDWTAAT
ncbi:MAG: hypothetical protein GY841_02715 [FCB group bacterium]|nr:hypothetical protein [FCB group bacterium]